MSVPSKEEFDAMIPRSKVRVRKTPGCRHPYTATVTRQAAYGWGYTPSEARDKFYEVRYRLLMESIQKEPRA